VLLEQQSGNKMCFSQQAHRLRENLTSSDEEWIQGYRQQLCEK
jgi:hypothetical protein